MGQRPLITFHVPQTVPLMSTIKAGHVRDTSVIRVLAPPPPPAVCNWSRRAQPYRTMSAGPTCVRVVRFGGRSPAGTTVCNLDGLG